jgi:hypothetical protein
MRVYPAYGRTITRHLVRGLKPVAIGVLFSTRWDYFDHAPKVCIRPDEWRANRFEFGFLRGQHVVVVPGDEALERDLAQLVVELMMVGPRLLWLFNADGSKIYDGDSMRTRWRFTCASSPRAASRRCWTLPRSNASALPSSVMAAAQARGSELWHREYQRIVEKRGEECGGRVDAHRVADEGPGARALLAALEGRRCRGGLMAKSKEKYNPTKALLANLPIPEGEADDYWEKNLEHNERQRIIASLRNVFLILTRDDRWEGVLGFDEFSNQVVKRKPPPFERGEAGRGATSTICAPCSGSHSTTASTPRRSW